MKLLAVALLPLLCFAQSPVDIVKVGFYSTNEARPNPTQFLPTAKSSYLTPINPIGSVLIGPDIGVHGTNTITIGRNITCTNENCIVIGSDVSTTKDNELVIKFTDGTELRQMLPAGKVIHHGLYEKKWTEIKVRH